MIVSINAELITAVTGVPSRDFQQLRALDLHLKDLAHQPEEDSDTSTLQPPNAPKIRKIDALHLVPNLRQLNLGYNAITRIEGLSTLTQLIELNLAENAIRKIENLDSLKSLERLNLSGNQIERIPESMKALHRLTHFRIARNQLTHIGDLQHLAPLEKLTNLRIDDNPISELEHIMISDKLREQGRKKYAQDQAASLKAKLNAEQHRLQRLRRELQSGNEANIVMQVGSHSMSLSRSQQVQLDDANRVLAMKLDEVKRVESEIQRLTDMISRMSTATPASIRGNNNEVNFSSPESDEYESESFEASRQFSNVKTTPLAANPAASSRLASSTTDKFRTSLPVPSTPAATEMAGKKIVDLNDKVEKLAAKVLTSEKEKQVLKTQLDHQKSYTDTIQRLHQELEECEQQLEQALTAAKQSNDEVSDLHDDNRALQTALQESRAQLQGKQQDIDQLQTTLMSTQQENQELRRQLREGQQFTDIMKKTTSATRKEDLRMPDLRLQAMQQKLSMDDLQALNERLSQELETAIKQSNQWNQALLRCREDNDALKGKLQVSEQGFREQESQCILLESEQRRLLQSNEELRYNQVSLLKDKEALAMKVAVLETDLQAVLAAKKRSSPTKSQRPAGQHYSLALPAQRQQQQHSQNYFEQPSMDSDVDGLDFPSTAKAAAHLQHQQQRRNVPSSAATGGGGAKLTISALERSAAEIIAHLILEEMSAAKSSAAVKEACVRAALRLVHTSSVVANDLVQDEDDEDPEGLGVSEEKSNIRTPTRNGRRQTLQVPLTPFHALGDRAVLSKLVADTHAGLVSLEDSAMLKEELRQLQKLQIELEEKVTLSEHRMLTKEADVKQLEKHAAEARNQAETCLTELSQLQHSIATGRDSLLHLEAEGHILQREVEVSRSHLNESMALTEIETKNLAQLRDRYQQLKQDHSDLDKTIANLKAQQLKEEQKLQVTKSTFYEKTRLLQSEKARLEQDCQGLQHVYEELRRRYVLQQEESELQQRDHAHHLLLQQKGVEEANAQHTSLNNEIRLLKYDLELLAQRKASLLVELQHVQDNLQRDDHQRTVQEQDRQQRASMLQKQLLDLEEKVNFSKSRLFSMEQESQAVVRRVEEVKQLQVQLETQYAHKQRQYEEHSLLLQRQEEQRNQQLQRISANVEDKQHAVDLCKAELRTLEKKREDVKVAIASYDLTLQEVQEQLRNAHQSKEKLDDELRGKRQQVEEVVQRLQQCKLQLQVDEKQQTDLQHSLNQQQQLYHGLQQREEVLKAELTKLKSDCDEHSQLLASLKLSVDRESRQVSELTSKKLSLDLEVQRSTDLLQQVQARLQQESHKQQDWEVQVRHAMEEFHRVQKQASQATQQVENWKRQTEEQRAQQLQHQQQQRKAQLELDQLHAQCQQERLQFQQLREDSQHCQLTLTQQQDALRGLEAQLNAKRQELEGMKLQHQHVEGIKKQIDRDVQTQQELHRQENRRLEKLESTYSEVEKQLKALKAELTSAEKEYETLRHLSLEESRKVEQQKRMLSMTVDELHRLEAAIQDSQLQLDGEKRRAVDELSKLEQAKRSAHAHMFLVNETNKRLHASKDNTVGTVAAKRHVSPSSSSRINIAHVSNTNTLPSSSSGFRASTGYGNTKPTRTTAATMSAYEDNRSDDEHSDSSSQSGAMPSSLQQAVEHLRMQSSAALASAQMT